MHNIEFMIASKEQVHLHMDKLIELEKDSELPQLWNKGNFLKELDSKWHLSKLLFHENSLIGYAIVSKKTESSCHIHRFIISASVRRAGFGNRLLNHLKGNILEDFEYLTLLVDPSNISAIGFYRKNSFKPLGDFEGNILMVYKRES